MASKLLLAVVLVMLTSASIGCGDDESTDDGDATQTSGIVAEPDIDLLRTEAAEFMQAVGDGRIEESYEFIHEAMRANCSYEEWQASVFPLDEFPDTEYRVLDVIIDDNRAEVRGDYFVGDTALGFAVEPGEEDPGYWIWDDGRWWAAADDVDGCIPMEVS